LDALLYSRLLTQHISRMNRYTVTRVL
jgi:hypothetical protein